MPDGAKLAGDLQLPAGDGPAPAIVCYYPYHKDDFIGAMYETHANAYFAEHGYATLLVDFRGLGGSSGEALDAMHRQEGLDGAEIVEWAAAQEWCDGNVGMWGLSYGGITSFKTAAAKPPHLRAIVPIMGSLDIYHDWVYPGGCRNMLGACGVWGSWMLAMQLLPPMHQDAGGRWREVWQTRLETAEPYLVPWADHPDHGPYWEERVVDPAGIETPMLSIGAWRDLFPQVMVDAYAGAAGPKKLLMGPWVHVHPDESDLAPIDHLHHMLRWWDRWLKDERNGVDDEAPVQFYLQGEDRWVETDRWPPAHDELQAALGAGGTLAVDGSAAAGEVEHTTDPATGTCAGLWDPFGLGIGFPLDQGPDDRRSATFTGEPLEAPLRIAGSPEARIHAAFEPGGEAQLVVKLVDVAPDGAAHLITTGWLNARHRRSHAEPEDVVAGETREYVVPLWATAYAVPAGHRLRVSVSGADFPRVWPAPHRQTLRISCGPGALSGITVPVAPEDVLREFTPEPQKDGADRWPLHIDSEPRWSIEHDLVDGATTVVSGARFVFDTPAEGGRIELDHTGRARVRRDRPDSANVSGDTVIEASMPDGENVRISASTLVTGSGLSLTGQVTVDGRTVFEKAWHR
jgi:putative CocE/NonD family hydrolase